MDTPRKAKPSGFKPFFWGIVLGAGVTAAVMYTNRPEPPPPSNMIVEASPVPCPEPKAKPAESTLPKKPEDFEFYDTLEKVPVPPTRPDLEQAPMPPTVGPAPAPGQPTKDEKASAKTEPFYLQIASYKSEPDADALKAKVTMAGVAVTIASSEIPDKGTYYRVRVGPFTSQAEVDKARAQLSQANISVQNAFAVR